MESKCPSEKRNKVDLSSLRLGWPSAYVARQEIRHFTGGLISEKYLANLDSQNAGPAGKIKCGRKVAYPVDEVVRWLEGRTVRGGT